MRNKIILAMAAAGMMYGASVYAVDPPTAGPFGSGAYSALFDHGLASKSDQRFASIRSTGNLTFSTAF